MTYACSRLKPLHTAENQCNSVKQLYSNFFKKTSFSLKYLQGSQSITETRMGSPLSSAVVTQIRGLFPPYLPRGRKGWWAEESHVTRRRQRGNEPASCRGNTGKGMTEMKTGRAG